MKKRILSLGAAFLAVVLITGCLKQNDPTPVVVPTGNFLGTFTRLHLNPRTNKIDTIQATVTLIMSTTTGYSVGGDTTHHAASHGTYVVDGTNIGFSDATLPSTTTTTTPPAKTHLNGVYQYAFDGTSIQMQMIGDTLAYYYNLKSL